MARIQWIKWLHRVGYFTTILVVLELVAIGALLFVQWRKDSEIRATVIEASRTHEGPLTFRERAWRPDEIDLLANVPSLPPAPGEGLRFVAMPSLQGLWFVYSLTIDPASDRGRGTLIAYKQAAFQSALTRPVFKRHFSISASTGRRYLAAFGKLTDGWEGSLDSLCTDGTGVAFELRSNRGVTSGSGNSACSDHYRTLGRLALVPVQSLIPQEYRPTGGDWRANDEQD